MANKITRAEREDLYKKATILFLQGFSQKQVALWLQTLMWISRDRARHAAAVAQMRGRGQIVKQRKGSWDA